MLIKGLSAIRRTNVVALHDCDLVALWFHISTFPPKLPIASKCICFHLRLPHFDSTKPSTFSISNLKWSQEIRKKKLEKLLTLTIANGRHPEARKWIRGEMERSLAKGEVELLLLS